MFLLEKSMRTHTEEALSLGSALSAGLISHDDSIEECKSRAA